MVWHSLLEPAVGLLILGAILTFRFNPGALKTLGGTIMQQFRQRAALAICLGIALVFADWRAFATFTDDPYWQQAHKAGWIALFGAATALIGIYHWITGPPDPKI